MKKILGLDLGTNSIGWAVTELDFENKEGIINGIGSRIIPMPQDILGKFEAGQSISQTADRTGYRGTRRLYQRDNLRRERLHRVLNILGFLPDHYKNAIDFEKRLGQFKKEVKLNYKSIKDSEGFASSETFTKPQFEFIFKDAFYEMIKEFQTYSSDELKIPYDWTIYYLRKKALKEKISKQELSWVILNFNQKRGYYQLRGEEEEISKDKVKTFEILKVDKIEDSGEKIKGKGDILYNVYFTNGWKYDKQITKTENWIGKTKEFIVTTSKTKDGKTKRTYKAVDSEKDWIAIKEKAQQDIDIYNEQNNTVGVANYIFDTLLKNPTQKIRGKLIKTIERKYYKEEFNAILETQIKYHKELQDRDLYKSCIEELYSKNEAHKNNIKDKDFRYLFADDIIFYQRPLKSKKSTISGCQYEKRTFYKTVLDKETGKEKKELVTEPIKAIPKSHPLFQEFRLWQFLKNLKIYQKEAKIEEKTKIDHDITSEIIQTEDDWVKIFDFLNDKKDITQKQLIDFLAKEKFIDKKDKNNYRWNYVEDKTYPANETRATFLLRLKKTKNEGFALSENFIINLWHIIYSVKDKVEYETALKTFARKNNLDIETFVENFKKYLPFKNDYGAYSEKAIKKMLPLMRRGKYWSENEISENVKERINQFIERLKEIDFDKKKIEEISDDDIQKQVLKSFSEFKDKNPYTALNTYQAGYAVYGRHSELSEITKWHKPEDIDKYLQNFKQHSLRNPIVEQVITETLRTVRDIWTEHGDFDEIHVELGRDMKNPANKRQSMSKQNTENENTNTRIKKVLKELMSDGVSKVKDYSPSHQEILKIYEDGIYKSKTEIPDDIEKIRKNSNPTQSDITRYKLWLEQGYISPYTGATISLSRLFTTDYQIEHIIPQSRYFDNSFSNKIICESEVNQLKDNQTAYEFIKNHHGEIVNLSQGKQVKVFELADYETHCNKYFKNNKSKLKKLLSEEIPEGFIKRQMNDSRYISKVVKGLLSNIVREEGEQAATSKNLIPVTGAITSKLKQDWGLNKVWNEIIRPRFERLNKMTNSNDFGYWDYQKDKNGNNTGKQFFRIQVPDEISKGFKKKRIDHRHHALDALVIACTSRKHIQYLNSLNNHKEKYDLQPSLMIKNKEGHYTKHFIMPWNNFVIDAKNKLEKTIISFKQNLRVINKTNNKYWKWIKQKNGTYKKMLIKKPLQVRFLFETKSKQLLINWLLRN